MNLMVLPVAGALARWLSDEPLPLVETDGIDRDARPVRDLADTEGARHQESSMHPGPWSRVKAEREIVFLFI
jgi:hypothetical protein